MDPDLAKVLDLKEAVGFLVITVVEDSPAYESGLIGSEKFVEVDGTKYPTGGDIILAVDGIDVRKIDDILIHLNDNYHLVEALQISCRYLHHFSYS